jgi:hypothetical protein
VVRPSVYDLLAALPADPKLATTLNIAFFVLLNRRRLCWIVTPRTDLTAMRTPQKKTVQPSRVERYQEHRRNDGEDDLHPHTERCG